MELVYFPCAAIVFDYMPCLLYDARESLAYEGLRIFKRDFTLPFETAYPRAGVGLESDEGLSAACPYSEAALVVAHEVGMYDFRVRNGQMSVFVRTDQELPFYFGVFHALYCSIDMSPCASALRMAVEEMSIKGASIILTLNAPLSRASRISRPVS